MHRAALALLLFLAAEGAMAGPRAPAVASYRIVATVKDDGTLEGRETLTFTNRSGRSFDAIPLRLFLNGFRRGSTLAREWTGDEALGSGPHEGGIDLTGVSISGGEDLTRRIAYVSPDASNPTDRTLALVSLPATVPAGGTVKLDIAFVARLPRALLGTGTAGDFVLVARFFPELAEGAFGDVEAVLTVPSAWKGKTVSTGLIVRSEDTKTPGRARLTFRAEDVNGFAVAACPRCEVHTERVEERGLPAVSVTLLLQPDHRALRARYLATARAAIVELGTRYAPYPHAELALVDPPWNGAGVRGASYPGLVVGGGSWLSPRPVPSPESVTLNGLARQWFGRLLACPNGESDSLCAGLAAYAANRLVASVSAPRRSSCARSASP